MMKENKNLIVDYEVNPFTMVIKPFTYEDKTYSKIYEVEDSFISSLLPLDIIKKSCDYYGSSYDGRREGTKNLINITHKAPIAIDPTNSIYLFPTTSPAKEQCIWVSHRYIVSYKRSDSKKTIVKFKNNQTFEIPISCASFENQIQRTTFLQVKLTQRIEETIRKSQQYWQQFNKVTASEANSFYHFNRIS